jgi:uncharacterized protein YjbI with pentapeptide repeats
MRAVDAMRDGQLLRRLPRIVVSLGALLIALVSAGAPAHASIARTAAANVIDGCAIVANPTPSDHTDCPGADLNGANLNYLDLSYAVFTGAHLNGAKLRSTNLSFSSFRRAGLHNADFSADVVGSTVLTGANFNNAVLDHANLTSAVAAAPSPGQRTATFRYADLKSANLHDWKPIRADLRGATFTGATITGVDFQGANLSGDDLSAMVIDANFRHANLVGVTFAGSSVGGDFTRTVVVPATQTATASGPDGAAVTWPSPQQLPGLTPVGCDANNHPVVSGDTFPIGTTTVTCYLQWQSADGHSVGASSGKFWVHVLPGGSP